MTGKGLWTRVSSSLVSAAVFSVFGLFACATPAMSADVVFDECHAQQAGNADWTAKGGFSDYAQTFTEFDLTVVSAKKGITAEILKNAAILVLPEPNSVFTQQEKTAIFDFVKRGGGLVAIADHKGADRNNDGIDAIGVLNQIMPEFGLQFDVNSISEFPIPVDGSDSDRMLYRVKTMGTWAGTTVSATSPNAKALIPSRKQKGKMMIGYSAPEGYKGRVVAFGDSSCFDDGTGAPGKKLYDGYNRTDCSHIQLAKNSIQYLLGKTDVLFNVESKDGSQAAANMASKVSLGENVSKHWDPSHPGHSHECASCKRTYNQPGDNGPNSAGYYRCPYCGFQNQVPPSQPSYPQQPTYPQYPNQPTYPQYPTQPTYPQYPTTPQYDDAAYYNAGMGYFNSGNYMMAIDNFKRLVNSYPGSALRESAMYYLAQSYKSTYNYAEAKNTLSRMINEMKTSPNRINWFFAMAEVFEAGYQFVDAARWYQAAARDYHYDKQRAPEAMFRAGQAYEKAYRNNDAAGVYRQLMISYPYSPFAGSARDRINAMGYGF